MKTFLRLTSISIQGQLYYKTSFFINLLTPFILLAGQYLLWTALYAGGSGAPIGGMGREEMYTYILVSFAMGNLIGWSGENMLAREIRSGTVVARCVRPAAFLVQSVAEMAGGILIQGVVNLAIVLAAFFCFGRYLKPPLFLAAGIFVPCLFLAVLLRIMLIDIFSLLCFFTTGYLGLAWTRNALFEFFSGAMIPVIMFPGWLKTFTYATPFPYMLQVPAALLLGQELPVSMPMVFVVQSAWLIVFLLLHSGIYGLARRNMTIAGG